MTDSSLIPEKCHLCSDPVSPDAFETQDGDLICPSCEETLCEWCQSRTAEHEIGTSYVCQSCCESRGDALYEAMKDRD